MANKKLIAARKEKGWSIEVASARVGVSRVTYSRWENGHQEPQPSVLDMLCEAFDKTAEELGYEHLSKKPLQAQTQKETVQVRLQNQQTIVTVTNDQAAILLELLGNGMKHFDGSKRATLEKLLGITGALFLSPLQDLAGLGKLLHDEEILAVCETNIPIYWRLYFDGQLTEVTHILPGVLAQLARLTERPSSYQAKAASLASKAHQLACMLALQPQDFKSALIHADQALQYARLSEDFNLQVASLIRRALVYFYLKRPNQRLWAYQEASQYLGKVSPLLQGRVYMGLAEAYSSLAELSKTAEHKHHALSFLERMYSAFPDYPKEDPNYTYTHFKLPQGYEGLIYLNLGQPGRAWDTLTLLDKAIPISIVPDRVELTIRQTRALIALDDLTQAGFYLESAVNSAQALGSDLRYQEAFDLHQKMLQRWPHESQVKDLAELFAGK